MDYCMHDNNIKACHYCKINRNIESKKQEKEKFLEKNEKNEVLSFTWYFVKILVKINKIIMN